MLKKISRRLFSTAAISTLSIGSKSFSQEGWNPDLNNPELGFDTHQDETLRLSSPNRVRRNTSAFRGRSNWKNYFSNYFHAILLFVVSQEGCTPRTCLLQLQILTLQC